MNEPLIENGFAVADAGSWLVSRGQPAAARESFSLADMKGFIVPDRRPLQLLTSEHRSWLASAERPFLTHLTCTDTLTVVSAKILIAPAAARTKGRTVRVIPMSYRWAFPATVFGSDWVITATESRLTRIVLNEGESLTVRLGAAVAWTGANPTGFCPRLRLRDLFFPRRGKPSLSLDFFGPQVVWTEGCHEL